MSCPIPEAKREAVARALAAAFGVSEPDGPPVALSGGLSGAAVFRIRVGGIAYALRLTLERDDLRDPARGFACMATAAEAFLAPTVRYASADDGVAITDLVAAQPLFDYPGDGGPLVVELAQTIRLLHQTPAFPELVDYMAGMDELVAQHRASGILDPAATTELFDRYAALARTYHTAPQDRVSSHNDINPGNLIYDGRRLWLIDWEAAFRADRYVDLATAANWLARTPALEERLLATYFGAPPTAEQRARFEVMKAVNHVFLGVMFLSTVAAGRPGAPLADRTLAGPPLAEMHAGLGSGAVSFARWEDRAAYGKSRLAQALESLRSDTFAQALARVAEAD
jgi:aminoglycoside phosphotransferase (APT) family kinase protein